MDAKPEFPEFHLTIDGRLMIGDTLIACLYFDYDYKGGNWMTIHIIKGDKNLEIDSSSSFLEIIRRDIEI